MADPAHLELLRQGVRRWNADRPATPDLSEAKLQDLDLAGVDLSNAKLTSVALWAKDLHGADLTRANLRKSTLVLVNLRHAKLIGADLGKADVRESDLRSANLTGADLFDADLTKANLAGASLRKASLQRASLVEVNLNDADLTAADLSSCALTGASIEGTIFTSATVHGCSAWRLRGEPSDQRDLLITEPGEPPIKVDNFEAAQFIYLLLRNPGIRDALDAITRKAVLILGRFSAERKRVLEALRSSLRAKGYVPIIFDFEPPRSRDLTETITLLARLCGFIIVDLTDPSSVPHELASIVPHLPDVPVQPLLSVGVIHEYAMFEHLKRYPWVMDIHPYESGGSLLAEFDAIVERMEKKRNSIQRGG